MKYLRWREKITEANLLIKKQVLITGIPFISALSKNAKDVIELVFDDDLKTDSDFVNRVLYHGIKSAGVFGGPSRIRFN